MKNAISIIRGLLFVSFGILLGCLIGIKTHVGSFQYNDILPMAFSFSGLICLLLWITNIFLSIILHNRERKVKLIQSV